MERTIVGIDVGTTKICTLVGQVDDHGELRITGVGVAPARGIRKGVITDLEEATKAIGESVQKAERVANTTISAAYVAVGGGHVSSMNSRGFVSIGKGDRPVDRDDVERAMDAAQAVTLPHNRRIIHSIPREYIIDGQDGIRNPLGLMGYRLEVEAHIVTGAVTSIQNLVQCVERNGIEVIDLVLQPLASAEAVLSEEEKNMGVVLIDMGGGTTDTAVFVEGSVWDTLVFAVGGNHITTDIAIGLRTPFVTAEDIKIRYAHTNPFVIDEAETIDVTTFGDEAPHSVSRRELCQIVAMRTEEMFDLIAREIRRSGFESLLPAGMVLTGGTADLRGIRDLASQRLQAPVRIGYPRRVKGLMEAISSPAFSTAVGLLLWGMKAQQAAEEAGPRPTIDGTWFQRLIEWLRIFLPRR